MLQGTCSTSINNRDIHRPLLSTTVNYESSELILTVGGCFFDFFANGSSSEDESSTGAGFSETDLEIES